MISDHGEDAARYALMSWFFEENLAEFAPYKDEQARETEKLAREDRAKAVEKAKAVEVGKN